MQARHRPVPTSGFVWAGITLALLGKQTNSNYASLRILAAKLSEDAAVLKKLAQDKNQQVRSAVAENTNTPALVLAKLGVAAEVNAMAI